MTRLSPEICFQIRNARRAAGISQSALAEEVGCKQSAISMFEQGDGTKLNDEVVEKLAKKFGVDLNPSAKAVSPVERVVLPSVREIGFCPNPHCPSNRSYEVEGRKLLKPDRAAADPVGGKFCVLCGEVLEKHCPNCGSSVHDGAICSFCGSPYVIPS